MDQTSLNTTIDLLIDAAGEQKIIHACTIQMFADIDLKSEDYKLILERLEQNGIQVIDQTDNVSAPDGNDDKDKKSKKDDPFFSGSVDFLKYMREVKQFPKLSSEEITLLAAKYAELLQILKTGPDEKTESRRKKLKKFLAAVNQLLVVKILFELLAKYTQCQKDKEDLIQQGNIGLLLAIENFDPKKGCKFSTYAHPKIEHMILDAIKESLFLTDKNKFRAVKDECKRFSDKHHRAPLPQEISPLLNLSAAETERLIKKERTVVIYVNSTEMVGQQSSYGSEPDPAEPLSAQIKVDEELYQLLENKIIKRNPSLFTEEEKTAMELRHKDGLSFKEICRKMGVSVLRAEIIYNSAMTKLRKFLMK